MVNSSDVCEPRSAHFDVRLLCTRAICLVLQRRKGIDEFPDAGHDPIRLVRFFDPVDLVLACRTCPRPVRVRSASAPNMRGTDQ